MRDSFLTAYMNLFRTIAVAMIVLLIQITIFGQVNQPTPTPHSQVQNQADELFLTAQKLEKEGTPESLVNALAKYREAARLFRDAGDKRNEGYAYGYAGVVNTRLGNQKAAIDDYVRSIALFRESGAEKKSIALTLNSLGRAYVSVGEPNNALNRYLEALTIFKSANDLDHVVETLVRIADSYRDLRNSEKALAFLSEASQLYKERQDKVMQATMLAKMGWIYGEYGDKKKALEKFIEALPLVEGGKDPNDERIVLENIGDLNRDLRNFETSISSYSKALQLSEATGNKPAAFQILLNLALCYRGLRKWETGIDIYNRAFRIVEEVGDKKEQGVAMFSIGSLYQESNDNQKAVQAFQEAISLFRSIDDKADESTTLNSLGLIFIELNQNQKALDSFQQALLLSRTIKDKFQEGMATFNIGGVHEKNKDFTKAISYYNEALLLFREVGSQFHIAVALSSIGFDYASLGEREKALEFLDQALVVNRQNKNRSGEASTLNSIGIVYNDLGQLPKTFENYTAALKIYQEVGLRAAEADMLVNIGQALEKVGDVSGADERYSKALPIYRELKDRKGEARALAGIGLVHQIRGEVKKAEELFAESLTITRSTGDKEGESYLTLAFALFLNSAGDYAKASENFKRASEMCEPEDKMCLASTQIGLGMSYYGQAEHQKAIDTFTTTLSTSRSIGFAEGEIASLNSLGQIYSYLGLNERSMETFRQALKISESIGRKESEAVSLGNIGQAYFALEDFEKALEYHKRALSIAQKSDNKQSETTVLNNVGLTLVEMKKPKDAIEYFEKSLIISRAIGSKPIQATALLNLGYAYSEMKDHEKALTNLNQALSLSRILGDSNIEAFAVGTIGLVWFEQKNLRFAAFYCKQALNIIQSLRTKLRGFDPETQKAFTKRFEKSYRKLADIFVEMGRIAEAERVLAMLKEDEYSDFLRRDDKVADDLKTKLTLTSDEQKAFDDYKKYADSLTALGKEYGDLQAESKRYEVGQFPKQKRLDELDKLLADATKVFNTFLDDLKNKFSESSKNGGSDLRVALLESGSQSLLKELGQPNTVMISTIAGEDRLNIIVTTADAQRAHTVDLKSADLNKLVSEFRLDVKNPRVDPRIIGKKLYDVLFPASLQKDLEGVKADTIVWSLDGTLRYVPIAALWDGKQYLVEKYKNVLVTLASRDKLGSSPADRSKWQALGVGVSKQATLKDTDGTPRNFEALSSVPEELCSVVADPAEKKRCSTVNNGKTGVVTGKSLLDEQFTLQTFKNSLGRYPIVHIASHFSLNTGNENDSYLLLGGGDQRKLTLADVRQGGAKFSGVELLTLSACNTAMSTGNRSNGVEVEGFGALAQNQGAKSVVASLWAVADTSTRDLMIEFYKQLEATPKVNKAEAMQRAQLSLLNGKYTVGEVPAWRTTPATIEGTNKSFKPDPKAPFAHPYYWSPFILMGNWQ